VTKHRPPRDAGFTLPEILIALVLTSTITAVIALTISVSLRALPNTRSTADSGVAVQGITTWLPPDVDSTEPGELDVDPSKPSGCSGADPGINLLHLGWAETFAGTTTRYVADYRFVTDGATGRIVRVSCSGIFTLGSPSVLNMSAKLSTTVPTVTTLDGDGDGLDDQVTFSIETLAGDVVYIDAASKNPHETLPPASTTPTTSTTTLPNQAPIAYDMAITVELDDPFSFEVPVYDPDGDAMTVSFENHDPQLNGTTSYSDLFVTINADSSLGATDLTTYTFWYTVDDTGGLTSNVGTVTVHVDDSVPTPSTSTSTTSTTTTTLPPCIVSSISVSPSTVGLKFNDPSKLKEDVEVEITLGGGYCVGLTLQYDTGAPNGQYVQNFGNTPPYVVILKGHPQGTELWSAGTHALEVRDGTGNLLTTATLTVTT
jgi:prepilin-type N-terminal cleavage/methylation domain-containing protein